MQINSTKYEQNETNFITEAGNYLMKIVEWEQDGYSQNGELKIKVLMSAKKITAEGKLEGNYTTNYFMYDGEKAGFTIAMLRDALKSPKVFELDSWVDRFIIARVEMEASTTDGKNYARIKGFEYSKFNDKLPPFQEIKAQSNEPKGESVANHSEDLEDTIPF